MEGEPDIILYRHFGYSRVRITYDGRQKAG